MLESRPHSSEAVFSRAAVGASAELGPQAAPASQGQTAMEKEPQGLGGGRAQGWGSLRRSDAKGGGRRRRQPGKRQVPPPGAPIC